MKRIIMLLLIVLPLVILSACSTPEENNSIVMIYNSARYGWQSNGKYILDDDFMLHDKTTNECFTLINDPFAKGNIGYASLQSEMAYCLELYGESGSWRISEINLKDFGSSIIYDNNKEDGWDFLGISFKDYDVEKFLGGSVESFFVTDRYIFMEWMLPGLMRYDRLTGQRKAVITDKGTGNYFSDGENIYYINDSLQLKSYSIKNEKESTLIDNMAIADICLIRKNAVVFKTYETDGNNLYIYENGKCESIGIKANLFTAYDDRIFFTDGEGGLYSLKQGNKPIFICQKHFDTLLAMNDNKYIFGSWRNENGEWESGMIEKTH